MIIFLYGPDTFRSRRKLNELTAKFKKEVDPSGSNIAVVNGEKADLGKLNEAIASASLLAKKRLIVIENLFANKLDNVPSQFLAQLKKHKEGPDSNIIIVWSEVGANEALNKAKTELFKFLSKQKYAQEFKILSNTETAAWIKKEVEARGGKIAAAAASELAALVACDLWQINNEIDKLVNLKAGQKLQLGNTESDFKIEVVDVAELVAGVFDERIFALTDALANKQKSQAAKLLEEQVNSGAAAEYILSMIIRQYRILLSVRQAVESGDGPRAVAAHLKLHPFVAQKSLGQARNFTLVALKNLLDRLLEIDYRNKSGQADVLTSLDLLIAKL
jgi:DNA polymerase-3 subunit delta